MIVLDCETYESAIRSVCQIYGVKEKSAEELLVSIDLEKEFEKSYVFENFNSDKHVRNLFEQKFGPPIAKIEEVSWFHLTRTVKNSDFSDGILPLGLALDRIWEMLTSLLEDPKKKENLATMHANGVPDFQYSLKTNNSIHHGPYAMLVRDAAFNSEKISNHDYLETPEIIEDICNGYKKIYGHSIYEEITKKLDKCIVKFNSDKYTSHNLLAPAILYCWCVVRGDEFSSFANTCFDAEGTPIHTNQIVSVSFL